jgi:hypothetical protein
MVKKTQEEKLIKKKKGKKYTESFCKNKHVSGCKSRTTEYNDGRVIVSSHNSRCYKKMKRDASKKDKNLTFENQEEEEVENVNEEEEELKERNENEKEEVKEEEDDDNEEEEKEEEEEEEVDDDDDDDDDEKKDIKIYFANKHIEDGYRKRSDDINKVLLRKEQEFDKLCTEHFRISDFINYQQSLEECGFIIFPKESFKLLKDDYNKTSLLSFLGKIVRDYEEKVKDWMESYIVKGYFFFNELVGGVIFKKLQNKNNDDDDVIQIILLIVERSRKHEQGIERKIMFGMVKVYPKILVYSDAPHVNFYEDIGFKMSDNINLHRQFHNMIIEKKSVIMSFGFI